METKRRAGNTPIQELAQIEIAVRKEFGENRPSKAAVIQFLKTKYNPGMDGGATALLLLLLKYGPIASLALSGYSAIASGKKPPKCPEKGCGKRQVTVDTQGRSVCSNGHKWRPK